MVYRWHEDQVASAYSGEQGLTQENNVVDVQLLLLGITSCVPRSRYR